VFERFYRGGLPGTDGGTGLGLASRPLGRRAARRDIGIADATSGCRVQVVIPFQEL